jgi:hypothetical protein
MSAFGVKADMRGSLHMSAFDPKRTFGDGAIAPECNSHGRGLPQNLRPFDLALACSGSELPIANLVTGVTVGNSQAHLDGKT